MIQPTCKSALIQFGKMKVVTQTETRETKKIYRAKNSYRKKFLRGGFVPLSCLYLQ